MTEKHIKRDYFAVLKELFVGKDAALLKYAKVRHTQYEMNLWREYKLPLGEVSAAAKAYFSRRFLGNTKIDKASKNQIEEAFKNLYYAVGILPEGDSGCHMKCRRLVLELNGFLTELGLETIKDPEAFLDWLTFYYHTPNNEFGGPMNEPGYGFQIKIFHDEQNFNDFRFEVKSLIESKKQMSMQNICRIVLYKRKVAVVVK